MPAAYMEIGPSDAGALRLAGCDSLVVDPDCTFGTTMMGHKRAVHVYRYGSHALFESHGPSMPSGIVAATR